ncbi:HNH endonuclease signature motif containing protein [Nocardioides koreensis]|uniref:HNH endonuclease signature motif containing protein n=1 Tax=Nocardioides koreensis TaxID=433651 RepID=A0ABN2ZRE2_9ACTN
MFERDATGAAVLVEDLDPTALLDVLEQRKLGARAEERGKLRLAAQWCVLHPATADTGVATWAGDALPGVLNADESLGGEGTPAVSAFAPEPVAAALGVSTMTGMKLIADALDLQHRLPRIWRLVEDLRVDPWKARHVAQATHPLSREAAGYVDLQLAPRLASCGFAAIQTAVAMAIAKYHPELLEQREKQGRKGWHVTLRHPAPGEVDGTSYLDVAGDTLDLTAFHDLVCDQAAALKALGDTDELEIRKAKALGVLAAQQATLDLVSLTGDSETAAEPAAAATPVRRRQTILYVHASLADLLHLDQHAVGQMEKLGPATLAKLRDWLNRSEDVVVRPVLDLNRCPAVDGHDPSEEIREIVILRDGHCVFPWCAVDARHTDLDHIEPYLPLDEGGPPGQTNPHNLACLCRRHHRCKTSGRWRYRRRPDGTYEWHGPHGRSYLVTPLGTLEIHNN